ncbi:MAG TPA: DUF2273 domain-containing protein [Clostridiales bacterium]|nr:DUF2273 domain-containing protein [Clostridiales bacterium]
METCFTTHKGRSIGVVGGLILGILILSLGFWRGIFLVLCAAIGYWLGSFRDKEESFLSILDKILPDGIRNKMQ